MLLGGHKTRKYLFRLHIIIPVIPSLVWINSHTCVASFPGRVGREKRFPPPIWPGNKAKRCVVKSYKVVNQITSNPEQPTIW